MTLLGYDQIIFSVQLLICPGGNQYKGALGRVGFIQNGVSPTVNGCITLERVIGNDRF
ncbi:MAG: hypothetical protein ACO1OQ_10120 [Rufibacter sp.]